MEQKKISKHDYESLESFAAAVHFVQRPMSKLNHHLEVLKRTGDVVALNDFGLSLSQFIDDIVAKYKASLSDE